MTDEHAMKVWQEACGAYEDNSHDLTLSIRERTIAGDQAATAVLAREFEADRVRIEALRVALSNALAMIGHKMPMSATAMVAGETLIAGDVWKAGCAALKDTSHD